MSKTDKERDRLFKKYPYIVAWGQLMGSYGYYIQDQCEKAEEDKAVFTACYYNSTDNRWVLLENLREGLKNELEDYKNGIRGL